MYVLVFSSFSQQELTLCVLLSAGYKVEVKYTVCELTVVWGHQTLFLDMNNMEYVP